MAVILVADDEEMVRTLVSRVLKSAGHEVMTAANGLEAVAIFRSFPKRIALVITDLRMPVMDGYQVVKLVREAGFDTRIICMTGYAETVPECTQFLVKPFRMEELRKCVEQVLGGKR
jgi:CheY-like chemotaxis protein